MLGDSLVSASGDPKGMGWIGRVIAKTPSNDPTIDFFALPVPEETSNDLAERWAAELQRRLGSDTENRLVLALSNTDPMAGISISRSRLNLATILDEAKKSDIPAFVIGPAPHRNPSLNYDIEHLASGYEDVANRREVPFVDIFRPLVGHEGWNSEISESPQGRPGQVGHGLIAWLVLNRGWYQWLEIPDPFQQN